MKLIVSNTFLDALPSTAAPSLGLEYPSPLVIMRRMIPPSSSSVMSSPLNSNSSTYKRVDMWQKNVYLFIKKNNKKQQLFQYNFQSSQFFPQKISSFGGRGWGEQSFRFVFFSFSFTVVFKQKVTTVILNVWKGNNWFYTKQ